MKSIHFTFEEKYIRSGLLKHHVNTPELNRVVEISVFFFSGLGAWGRLKLVLIVAAQILNT